LDLVQPFLLDIAQRGLGVNRVGDQENIRVRVRERTQAIVIFLSGSIPEAERDRAAVHHDVGSVVVEHSRDVLVRKAVGSVADERRARGEDAEGAISREQIEEIAEAVETMAGDSALATERAEMDELEGERRSHQHEIDEAASKSRSVKMLDSSVKRMMEQIRAEMEDADGDIGQSFRSLDLDGDGIMSQEELLEAMEALDPEKRPNEAAFRQLLAKIDFDKDGKISLDEWRSAVEELQMKSRDEGEEGGKDKKASV